MKGILAQLKISISSANYKNLNYFFFQRLDFIKNFLLLIKKIKFKNIRLISLDDVFFLHLYAILYLKYQLYNIFNFF